MTGYIDWRRVVESLSEVTERVGDVISSTGRQYIVEFCDAGEWGLALDQLVYELAEHDTPISADIRTDIMLLAEVMRKADEISAMLAHCPERT